jgi:hypothetical protein
MNKSYHGNQCFDGRTLICGWPEYHNMKADGHRHIFTAAHLRFMGKILSVNVCACGKSQAPMESPQVRAMLEREGVEWITQ